MKYADENGELHELTFKTPYNHDTRKEAYRTATTCLDPTLAQQSAKEETDINTIVNNFLKTGQLPTLELPENFGDFSEIGNDFHQQQTMLAETAALFYKLPANLRYSYKNDPMAWANEVNRNIEAGNRPALRSMGFDIPDAPAPEPALAPAAPAPTDGGTPAASTGGTPKPAS